MATRARSAGSLMLFSRSTTFRNVSLASTAPVLVWTTSTPNCLNSSGLVPNALFIFPIEVVSVSCSMPMSAATSLRREACSTVRPVESANLPAASASSWAFITDLMPKPANAVAAAMPKVVALAASAPKAALPPALILPIAPSASAIAPLNLSNSRLAALIPASCSSVMIGILIAIRKQPFPVWSGCPRRDARPSQFRPGMLCQPARMTAT